MPPETETLAEPLFPPIQDTCASTPAWAVSTVDWVISAVEVAVQPFLSVTVTVYVPVVRAVAVAEV